jgi:hypothetical protein
MLLKQHHHPFPLAHPDLADGQGCMSACNQKPKEKGEIMTNNNCLEGIRCPNCGHEDGFRIDAQITVYVTDDGTEDEGGHYAWDGESPCRCAECNHAGRIKDFRIENQSAEQEACLRGLGR